jgi:hypothetical protein
MTDNTILLAILILLNIVFFILGYIIGKFNSQQIYATSSNKSESFFEKNKIKTNSIKIDDAKYVTHISTEGLEKKYDDLGETTVSKNDTIISVNKLKNLKG